MPEDTPNWFRRREDPFLRIFEELERMMGEAMSEDMTRERVLPDGSKIREFGPFTYGYSMRVGPDGKPEIEEFGNIRPPKHPLPLQPFKPDSPFPERREMPSEKEALTDVFTKNDKVKLILEIPGVKESDIALQCTGRSLIILVDDEKRKEIELPAEVNPKNIKSTYRNGILEITLDRLDGEQEEKESGIKWL